MVDLDGAILNLHSPMVATGINKGACPFDVVRPFVRAWRHFHVAGRNFEEVATPTLIKNFKQNKQPNKKRSLERFFSLLNVIAGYLCM